MYVESMWHDLLSLTQVNRKSIKNIVFCGYSFPDADIHFKYLLKRIESILCLEEETERKIQIFNKTKDKEEEQRYERFFKQNSSIKIDYEEKSFEDFAQNPAEFLI